jgi:tRNA-binding EMAP/Myf-like protein
VDSSTAGIVALIGGAVALAALVVATIALVRLRRLRADQRVLLGTAPADDLVEHAARIDQEFRSLHAYVGEVASRLDGRLGSAEERLDGTIAYRGLVRFDAYNEMSGQQSCSIALLDAMRSGIVLSSIHHRDQARLYVKHVVAGEAEYPLSPEEVEAVRVALAGEPPPEPPRLP